MKGQTISSLLVAIALFGSTEGQLRADPGPECWQASKCETDAPISSSVLSSTDFPTLDDQAEECYRLCGLEGTCTHFTVNQFRGVATCYLLSSCTETFDEFCLGRDTCVSGPSDCTGVTDNADCLTIDPLNTVAGKIHWQCVDNDGNQVNGYKAASIKSQTKCTLSCESWEDTAGNRGYLQSTCQDDGTWSVTEASDGNTELAFPLFPDGVKYPTPAVVSNFECGCKSLDVKWPVNAADGETSWWYDPNFEAGTDFVCDTPISTDDGEYIIETGNTCILFCDSHLVATVRCLNGEWTGQPELGFWCYTEPNQDDELTPAPEENPGDGGL